MIRIRTGRDSLPSMKFDGKGGRDEADSYRFSTEDEDGKPRNSYGWAVSNLTILRGDGENKSWFGTVGNPTSRGALIYDRSEEHTSELQSLMRISYAVFCLKKKNQQTRQSRAIR